MSRSILASHNIGLISSDFGDEARVTIQPALTDPRNLTRFAALGTVGDRVSGHRGRASCLGVEPGVGLWASYLSALRFHGFSVKLKCSPHKAVVRVQSNARSTAWPSAGGTCVSYRSSDIIIIIMITMLITICPWELGLGQ